MRQGQNSKRSRGRSGGRRNTSPRHQSFDSNGPSIRIRGNAHQVYEKYIQMAQDANSAGDRVTAENMYQHAEHYFRIMNVDDGDSSRQQNRGNNPDQRQHARNPQHNQDGGTSPAQETGNQPTAPGPVENSEGLNGSGNKIEASGGNGAATPEGSPTDTPRQADEPGTERPPRRPRRNTSRSRPQPATSTVEESPQVAPAVVEPDVTADTNVADAEVVDAEAKDV